MNGRPTLARARVVPCDDADLPDGPCRGVQVGEAGTVVVHDLTDTVVEFNCQRGQIIPGWVTRVKATGTDATNIVATY